MPDTSPHFNDLVNQFLTRYFAGDYQQALDVLEARGPSFPEQQSQLLAWRAGMLALLGRVEDALELLQAAEELGYWYHEAALSDDPDYAALQGAPAFEQLKQRMAARRLAAQGATAPLLQVLVPSTPVLDPSPPGPDASPPAPHPLLLALHGNQSNLGMAVEDWQSPVRYGWIVAVPQSPQPGWSNGVFVWNDVTTAAVEMRAHLADLTGRFPVDGRAITAAGFSMGAHVAVRMGLDPAFRLRGVVAVEPWFDDAAMTELAGLVQSAPPSQTRFILIAGETNVEYYLMAARIHELLTARGIPSRLVAASNERHGYPEEFEGILEGALGWVME